MPDAGAAGGPRRRRKSNFGAVDEIFSYDFYDIRYIRLLHRPVIIETQMATLYIVHTQA